MEQRQFFDLMKKTFGYYDEDKVDDDKKD